MPNIENKKKGIQGRRTKRAACGKELEIVLVDSLCSVAFYCQRCGQIEIADVPLFCGRESYVVKCSHCGAEKAHLRFAPRKGLVVETSCVVCGTKNRVVYSLRALRSLSMEKIYCEKDHFELGYIGRWQALAEFLDFNAAEYDALHPHDAYNFMEHQQILLEAFNRLHDLAEDGELFCPCGGHEFTADIAEDAIHLECTRCGSSAVIPAKTADDLKQLQPGCEVAFLRPDLIRNR
ncbi:MAG: hypothetical protein MR711_04485 [Selenomonas sp.]|uniref:hypothetical protein n=1 Tax=Selenomonas sp. TaxID=2053611 RepID=UPI0025E907B5|nr:hypothetical protein [Selenomonas sp.]MCI6085498.1 hypothetical protein [Selenomonas sp.]MDY4416367.1 hypothetical protein [Selenomonas sp.]